MVVEHESLGEGNESDDTSKIASEHVEAVTPPHLLRGPLPRPDNERPDYVLVIPSYNRPQQLAEKTMRLILEQRVPLNLVFVFVADFEEHARYVRVLTPLGLEEEHIIVGVRGIMAQRGFIVNWIIDRYGALKHVVSCDDDLEGLFYKTPTGFDKRGGELGKLKEVEVGGFEAWIAHAAEAMAKTSSYIWSLNTSNNSYYMRSNVIGTSNGMCNGYLYGFLARQDKDLQPIFMTATEDRERSVRYFAKDGIMLRYKMYAAKTKCFKNVGGIQDDYSGSLDEKNVARKIDERSGHEKIAAHFQSLYSSAPIQKRKGIATMEGRFIRHASRNPTFAYGLSCTLLPRSRGEGSARSSRSALPPTQDISDLLSRAASGASASEVPSRRKKRRKLQENLPSAVNKENDSCDSDGPATSMNEAKIDQYEASNPCGEWECSSCTFINTALALSCSVCSAVRRDNSDSGIWVCFSCQAQNPSDCSLCIDCGRASSEDFVYIDSDSDGTDTERLHCERKPDRRVDSACDIGWTCSACTFINAKNDAPICEMCLTQREDAAIVSRASG